MGINGRETYTVLEPEGMNSFEQWAWDNWLVKPDAFWGISYLAFGVGVAATLAVVGTVAVIVAIKKRGLRGRKICLVTEQETEKTAEKREVVSLLRSQALPTPEKEGHRFLGWYYDRQYTMPIMPFDKIKDKTVLYAKWVKEGD